MQAALLSLNLKLHRLLVAVRTAANRARIIAWSRVRDDVGLTNQVCALKTRSGIQKSRRAVRLPFQSTFFFFFSIKLSAMHSSGYTIAKANRVCTQIKQYKVKDKINIHLY